MPRKLCSNISQTISSLAMRGMCQRRARIVGAFDKCTRKPESQFASCSPPSCGWCFLLCVECFGCWSVNSTCLRKLHVPRLPSRKKSVKFWETKWRKKERFFRLGPECLESWQSPQCLVWHILDFPPRCTHHLPLIRTRKGGKYRLCNASLPLFGEKWIEFDDKHPRFNFV